MSSMPWMTLAEGLSKRKPVRKKSGLTSTFVHKLIARSETRARRPSSRGISIQMSKLLVCLDRLLVDEHHALFADIGDVPHHLVGRLVKHAQVVNQWPALLFALLCFLAFLHVGLRCLSAHSLKTLADAARGASRAPPAQRTCTLSIKRAEPNHVAPITTSSESPGIWLGKTVAPDDTQ